MKTKEVLEVTFTRAEVILALEARYNSHNPSKKAVFDNIRIGSSSDEYVHVGAHYWLPEALTEAATKTREKQPLGIL